MHEARERRELGAVVEVTVAQRGGRWVKGERCGSGQGQVLAPRRRVLREEGGRVARRGGDRHDAVLGRPIVAVGELPRHTGARRGPEVLFLIVQVRFCIFCQQS